MNRYKKKVVLQPEAKENILQFDLDDLKKKRRDNVPITLNNPVDFSEIFGNSNNVEIEVGFGTGKFITEYSVKKPETNILGIEITKKMVDHVANKILDRKIENVKLLNFDARLFMEARVNDNCIDMVHVYFPDPWVKKRHLKRRVVNLEFLATAFRVLKSGGRFNLFTDHKDYLDYFIELKAEFNKFIDDDIIENYSPTSYELKWVKQGRSIYRAVLKKP